MKIFREGSASPDFLSSIKTDTNIIMCLHPSDKDVIHELKHFRTDSSLLFREILICQ